MIGGLGSAVKFASSARPRLYSGANLACSGRARRKLGASLPQIADVGPDSGELGRSRPQRFRFDRVGPDSAMVSRFRCLREFPPLFRGCGCTHLSGTSPEFRCFKPMPRLIIFIVVVAGPQVSICSEGRDSAQFPPNLSESGHCLVGVCCQAWPTFCKVQPVFADFGQHVGHNLAVIGQTGANSGQFRPRLVELLVDFPTTTMWPTCWPKPATLLVEFCKHRL